jgi:hypothetical protein
VKVTLWPLTEHNCRMGHDSYGRKVDDVDDTFESFMLTFDF